MRCWWPGKKSLILCVDSKSATGASGSFSTRAHRICRSKEDQIRPWHRKPRKQLPTLKCDTVTSQKKLCNRHGARGLRVCILSPHISLVMLVACTTFASCVFKATLKMLITFRFRSKNISRYVFADRRQTSSVTILI